MECCSDHRVYITIKDHEENVRNNTWRLINPSKSEVGHVSKSYLNYIIADASRKTEVNQLRNTATEINWLKNLSDKHEYKFINFDIAEFYLSNSKNILNKSIKYAKLFTKIEGNAIKAIKLARKPLLYNKDGTCVRKEDHTLFDVTTGIFNGTKICEDYVFLINYRAKLGEKILQWRIIADLSCNE